MPPALKVFRVTVCSITCINHFITPSYVLTWLEKLDFPHRSKFPLRACGRLGWIFHSSLKDVTSYMPRLSALLTESNSSWFRNGVPKQKLMTSFQHNTEVPQSRFNTEQLFKCNCYLYDFVRGYRLSLHLLTFAFCVQSIHRKRD